VWRIVCRSVRLFLFRINRSYRCLWGKGGFGFEHEHILSVAGHLHLQHLVLPELLPAGDVQAAAQEDLLVTVRVEKVRFGI
jgi:hypothetical protein